jgi:hypothetical protein
MPNVQLVVVFNHRYDANLPKLDAIYGERFGNIRYLMPFYDGPRGDVIPVYESSAQFSGFFAQAYRELSTIDADFFAFAGDDLLLHPRLNQENLAAELGLRDGGGYIKSLASLAAQPDHWQYTLPTLQAFRPVPFVKALDELPDAPTARRLIERHGITLPPAQRRQLIRNARKAHGGLSLLRHLHFILRQHQPGQEYPVVTGYADLIVISKSALREFCRFCGIFAAMNLWVETAVPTALALACKQVVVEQQTRWRGTELWQPDAVNRRMQASGYDISTLLAGYRDDELYVHPVKLSRFPMNSGFDFPAHL